MKCLGTPTYLAYPRRYINRMKEQIITVEGLGRLSVPPDAAVVEATVAADPSTKAERILDEKSPASSSTIAG